MSVNLPSVLEGQIEGERLDAFVARVLAGIKCAPSRSQAASWIREGVVSVGGKPCLKPGRALRLGERVELNAQAARRLSRTLDLEPLELPLDIIYQDSSVLVINKPAGLTVHPGAGNRRTTLVNALLYHLRNDKNYKQLRNEMGDLRPGIVHRLDKDTSGLLVVALNVAAHANLAAQFAKRSAKRVYRALAFDTPRGKRVISQSESGTVDAPVGRHPSKRKEMCVLKGVGRKAVTHWSVVKRMKYAALLDLRLETGRTHQIRVHLTHIGSPLIGDPLYGDLSGLPPALKRISDAFGRQALHAWRLNFAHPEDGREIGFEAPLPEDFARLISEFEACSP